MKSKLAQLLIFVAVIVAASNFTVKAQTCLDPNNTTVTGTVYRRVTDAYGRSKDKPAADVYVFAQYYQTQYPNSWQYTTTDFYGNYSFTDLGVCSQYKITLNALGITVNSNPTDFIVYTGYDPSQINFTILP